MQQRVSEAIGNAIWAEVISSPSINNLHRITVSETRALLLFLVWLVIAHPHGVVIPGHSMTPQNDNFLSTVGNKHFTCETAASATNRANHTSTLHVLRTLTLLTVLG